MMYNIRSRMTENRFVKIINDLLQDRNLRGFSTKWANRMSKLTPMTCQTCIDKHGTIVNIKLAEISPYVMEHDRCKCEYVPMRTKKTGTATNLGEHGVDSYLMLFRKLPAYYVTKNQARQAGWKDWKGNFSDVLPGKMIGGDIFRNIEGKLPEAPGRVWHEADINYDGGYRNRHRILYSSDGLIFVTYDHYQTYYEITTYGVINVSI